MQGLSIRVYMEKINKMGYKDGNIVVDLWYLIILPPIWFCPMLIQRQLLGTMYSLAPALVVARRRSAQVLIVSLILIMLIINR